jgi:hypothetical protein
VNVKAIAETLLLRDKTWAWINPAWSSRRRLSIFTRSRQSKLPHLCERPVVPSQDHAQLSRQK